MTFKFPSNLNGSVILYPCCGLALPFLLQCFFSQSQRHQEAPVYTRLFTTGICSHA